MARQIDETLINGFVVATDSRYVKKVVGKDLSSNDFTDAEKIKLASLNNTLVDSELDDTSVNPVQNNKVKKALDTKANTSDLAPVALSGDYTDLTNKPTLSSLEGVVTVEKTQNPSNGYLASYAIKQGGVQVGASINIPKDFLVKSVSVNEVETADSPVVGYEVGDMYIDFVINTKDSDETSEHLYLLVNDLVDVYTADGVTIECINNEFKVKAGGITSNELAQPIKTSLGYADEWNESPAHGITAEDIVYWNNKADSDEGGVYDVVEEYITALTNALQS